MYHIRLIKGMSYNGAVAATRRHPDVFTEDKGEYASAMKSGYFADLTGTGKAEEQGWDSPDKEDPNEADKEEPDVRDSFSDMSVDELKSYAEANGISLAGAKKKAEILGVIREAEAKAAEARSVLREQ